MTEKKLFEYMELKAMCMLCAAEASVMLSGHIGGRFENATEACEFLEKRVEDVINIRWDHEDKK